MWRSHQRRRPPSRAWTFAVPRGSSPRCRPQWRRQVNLDEGMVGFERPTRGRVTVARHRPVPASPARPGAPRVHPPVGGALPGPDDHRAPGPRRIPGRGFDRPLALRRLDDLAIPAGVKAAALRRSAGAGGPRDRSRDPRRDPGAGRAAGGPGPAGPSRVPVPAHRPRSRARHDRSALVPRRERRAASGGPAGGPGDGRQAARHERGRELGHHRIAVGDVARRLGCG